MKGGKEGREPNKNVLNSSYWDVEASKGGGGDSSEGKSGMVGERFGDGV